MADPVLNVLAGALRLWIRSQCDSIGSLELALNGSSWSLLRGRLDGVTLTARDACFQGLPLQHVELRSSPIAVDMKLLSPGQMLALKQPFQVAGEVSFNGRQLNSALLAEPWRWLGDWMAEQLMGLSPLGALRIDVDLLELQVPVAAIKTLFAVASASMRSRERCASGRRPPMNRAPCCRWTPPFESSRCSWRGASWPSKVRPASPHSAAYGANSGWHKAIA